MWHCLRRCEVGDSTRTASSHTHCAPVGAMPARRSCQVLAHPTLLRSPPPLLLSRHTRHRARQVLCCPNVAATEAEGRSSGADAKPRRRVGVALASVGMALAPRRSRFGWARRLVWAIARRGRVDAPTRRRDDLAGTCRIGSPVARRDVTKSPSTSCSPCVASWLDATSPGDADRVSALPGCRTRRCPLSGRADSSQQPRAVLPPRHGDYYGVHLDQLGRYPVYVSRNEERGRGGVYIW